MKILKINLLTNYKMLKSGSEINFLTKTRIDKDSCNNDLIKLENDFYYPVETVFIGKNSSGKSTVINLIFLIIRFILTGRIHYSDFIDQVDFGFEVLFYHDNYIYKYRGIFKNNFNQSNRNDFLTIVDEKLNKTTYKESYKKDLSNISFLKENLVKPNVGGDTSDINKLNIKDSSILVDLIRRDSGSFKSLINTINDLYQKDVFNTIVHMFDDSIEYIKPYESLDMGGNSFCFKRINQPELKVTFEYIIKRVSTGTLRGIFLFVASAIAFSFGGTILIDEIERSFNKNLVGNLMLLFNDKEINKQKATLIYSTHYFELLDESDRCDNINVLHRINDEIIIKNLHDSYQVRTDISKSNQFEQNAFDNLINYDHLMNLRRVLKI